MISDCNVNTCGLCQSIGEHNCDYCPFHAIDCTVTQTKEMWIADMKRLKENLEKMIDKLESL